MSTPKSISYTVVWYEHGNAVATWRRLHEAVIVHDTHMTVKGSFVLASQTTSTYLRLQLDTSYNKDAPMKRRLLLKITEPIIMRLTLLRLPTSSEKKQASLAFRTGTHKARAVPENRENRRATERTGVWKATQMTRMVFIMAAAWQQAGRTFKNWVL